MNLEDHGFSSQEQMVASIKPFAEHAGIMRKQLIVQGWSRTGAEQLATKVLITALTNSTTETLIQGITKRP